MPVIPYKNRPEENVDDDVKVEKEFVEDMNMEEIAGYHLVLDRVQKAFGKEYAVTGLSVCLKDKECFGLVGVNGSGKSTTFKLLTGDERITSGDAYVMGISTRKNLGQVHQRIGYCPKCDGLIEDFTARQILFIFCLIRGVRRERIKYISEELADAFGFKQDIDKRVRFFNIGNKRKLSAALAIVGMPEVIYLDEPTSGIDPASRRKIWEMICLVCDSGKLIVMITHSMGEVEALCGKIAIMAEGKFWCIGTPKHLKRKFSKGLVLKIQPQHLDTSRELIRRVAYQLETTSKNIKKAVLAQFPTAEIGSQYQSMLTFYVPLKDVKWSQIFTWMEANRLILRIEDYSISQTTLEEVFLGFGAK